MMDEFAYGNGHIVRGDNHKAHPYPQSDFTCLIVYTNLPTLESSNHISIEAKKILFRYLFWDLSMIMPKKVSLRYIKAWYTVVLLNGSCSS